MHTGSEQQEPVLESETRDITRIVLPVPARDGACVRLKRLIGTSQLDHVDPFLLLDEFRSENPKDYIAGFPDHPHRGIETVTYMIHGVVRHRDSMGNSGTVETGGAQWMTAGGGIIHSEMPEQREGLLWGYQLWVNLPAKDKMCAPRYQDIPAGEIPEVRGEDGSLVRVVTGSFGTVTGPVSGIACDPTYLDVTLPAGGAITLPAKKGYTALAFVVEGTGGFGQIEQEGKVRSSQLIVFEDGSGVEARAAEEGLRFLFITGKPFKEPIARYGPFVMNTEEEIRRTLEELDAGIFLKKDNILE